MPAAGQDPVQTPEPEDKAALAKKKHDHDDDAADEWGRESFPASDPPEY